VTGGAHDTLRDELARALHDAGCHCAATSAHLEEGGFLEDADDVLPVVLRYADTQVAAERAAVKKAIDQEERYWNDDFGWCIPAEAIDRSLGPQP
jgi:hypothetical protein